LLDELFYSYAVSDLSTSSLICYINSSLVGCSYVQANIIKIASYAYTTNILYQLVIHKMAPNYQILEIDPNNIFFKLFLMDAATFTVTSQSCFHGPKNWPKTMMASFMALNISQSDFLIWNYESASVSSYQIIYQIYIGYYSESIVLRTGSMTPFLE